MKDRLLIGNRRSRRWRGSWMALAGRGVTTTQKDGYSVSVVQIRRFGSADDALWYSRGARVASEPVTLVGHSYGGQ